MRGWRGSRWTGCARRGSLGWRCRTRSSRTRTVFRRRRGGWSSGRRGPRGAGADPLAGYVPPAEVADAERAGRYPLALISAASHEFLNTQFGNNPELRRRAGELTVRVHPDDAASRGLAEGQRVRVGNERGSFEAVLRVTDQVRPGVAATAKGHWPRFAGGANANAVVDERATDLGGGPVFHDTRVEITAAG
ncbi:molybdopterin dinucleotide binding domain-containing protein [Actinomadura sp. NTSP31]|uniref:molybdopterin dinucleotide binding domain-containing protein n=1 Tax=Actinomadura sp. NTSP31 TaxID=1735447 RepID=UPI0035C22AA5